MGDILLIFSHETETRSFQLKDFGEFMVLRFVSNDRERHPESLQCLHKIQRSELIKLLEGVSANEVGKIEGLLDSLDERGLDFFHVEVLKHSDLKSPGHSIHEDWATTSQSQLIIDEALTKGPFDSEVMLSLSDEYVVTNSGASWVLLRESRHLLSGKIITTTSRYYAPAKTVRYLGTLFGWRLPLEYRVAVRDLTEQAHVLSSFQEYCTRADLSIRHHNEDSKYQSLEWAVRIFIKTTGVTVKTLEQPRRKYQLTDRQVMKLFCDFAGPTKVEQLWRLSNFHLDDWAAIAHMAQLVGEPSSTDDETKWWWSDLPRLY